METDVLVLDDEPTVREVLVLALEVAGISAESAADGEQALKMVEELDPGVVVTDLHMPTMHGREFIRKLFERFGRRPAVIGASADLDLVERLQGDSRFHAVLPKPVDASALVHVVEDVIRRRRMSRLK